MAVTVLEAGDRDWFLFGLDMLKHHQVGPPSSLPGSGSSNMLQPCERLAHMPHD